MLRAMFMVSFLTEYKLWLATEAMKRDWISRPTRFQQPSWQRNNSER